MGSIAGRPEDSRDRARGGSKMDAQRTYGCRGVDADETDEQTNIDAV